MRPSYAHPYDQVVVVALYVGVLFPYLRTLPIGSDTQPLALLAALVLLLSVREIRVPRPLALLAFPVLLALALFVTGGWGLTAVRGLVAYVSVAAIAWATYLALRADGGMRLQFVEWSVYIWFAVGLIQSVVDRSFLNFLISDVRTSASRGVVSLAPEPTIYGVECLLLLLLVVENFRGRKRALLVALLLIQIVLFARSSMAVLFLALWGALYLVVNLFSIRRFLVGIAVAALVVRLVPLVAERFPALASGRLAALVQLAWENPTLLFIRDESANERLSAIVFSFWGFVTNGMMPHGFNHWREFIFRVAPGFDTWITSFGNGSRIMSGYGAALFELGYVGILIPAVLTVVIYRRYGGERGRFFITAAWLHLLFLAAVPLALPLIGFLFGYFAYYVQSAPVTEPEDSTGALLPDGAA